MLFVNRYKKVGYLDTDVGQPEFSPPGFLSLTVVDEVTPGNCFFSFCNFFFLGGGFANCCYFFLLGWI